MCEILESKKEIQQHLKKKMLIPVLGSGFSRGCRSRIGKVPSGDDYKKYMIDEIIKYRGYDVSKKKSYEKKQFSEISTLYHRIIPIEGQRNYLRNNFTEIEISDEKKKFLNINWPYIYTLNMDDAIERNSMYSNVIYSNRKIWDDIFNEEKCTIKLHGHVSDILSYEDSKCEIFDLTQYVQSLRDNKILLDKLKHDYEYMNLIYIGCSLSNEIDLLSVATAATSNGSHYFCSVIEPDEDEMIILGEYGITHCVLFDSYNDIYRELVSVADEAEKIDMNDLDQYKTYKYMLLDNGFEVNKAYLFHGKNPVNEKRMVTLPNFFISRELTEEIVYNIKTKGTQILVGPGCSGKTYVTLDIARKVVDRDTFVFQSRERVNDEAFSILLKKENCLVITDSKALSVLQIEQVIRTDRERLNYNNCFIIVENKSNRDLISLLSLLRMNEIIKNDEPLTYELKNKLSDEKTDELNEKLVKSALNIFSYNKTIADNIIDISSRLIQSNIFEKITPRINSVKDIACLVALATMEKVYSEDIVILNLEEEFLLQKKKAFPLIDDEGTWNFEKSATNNSPMKYVVNAEFWLYHQLDEIAKGKEGRKKVIDAYKYIVSKLIEHYGKPDIQHGEKNAPYKEFILFDNINQIFSSQGTALIRGIYETLNELLSTDPNYLHQRAKCYIRSALKTTDSGLKQEWLIKAQHDAASSNKIFEQRYEQTQNEKIQISAAHTLYTVALTLCHLAKLYQYNDIRMNETAIETLYLAISSPYNSMEFIKKDKAYNYNNVVDNVISTLATTSSLILEDRAKEAVAELIKIQITEKV